MKKRRIRFSPEITITAVLAAALCYSMSYWQWGRYQGKLAYETALERAESIPERELAPENGDWQAMHHLRVRVSGTWEHAQTMFLINRAKDGEAGVKVVTPFRLSGSETRLLVDRGWLPFDDFRAEDRSAWQPEGAVAIAGRIRPSQTRNFFLSPPQKVNADGSFRETWFRLEVAVMAEQLPYRVLPVFLEQTDQGATSPVHDPREVLGSGVHLNYTIQWASFGTFALFLAAFVQLRPRRRRVPADPPEGGAS